MNDGAIFSPKVLIGWIAAATATFALTFWLMASGTGVGNREMGIGPSAFSRSAIGYSALADLLRRLNIPVEKSRSASQTTNDTDDVVVVAEPRGSAEMEADRQRLTSARITLYILPKWFGREDPDHSGWISEASPVPIENADWMLKIIGVDAKTKRMDKLPPFSQNEVAVPPTISGSAQLIESKQLVPLIGTADGMLLGYVKVRNRQVWVLSDPDVLSNFGLSQGENATFASNLFDWMRQASGAVIFDETVHGYQSPSAGPLRIFVTWPYVIATLQGVLAIGLLAWATVGRFGVPQPPEPSIAPGKAALVTNAARLIALGGHQDVMARRYVETLVEFVGNRLHAPAHLSFPQLIAWLANAAEARNISVDTKSAVTTALEAASDARRGATRYVAAIETLHIWKQELIYGRYGHSRDR